MGKFFGTIDPKFRVNLIDFALSYLFYAAYVPRLAKVLVPTYFIHDLIVVVGLHGTDILGGLLVLGF